MKLYISFDMEGISGVVDWDQATGAGRDYEIGVGLTLDEINAAIDGAVAGGATEIIVNDSHWKMRNIDPSDLHGSASYISGSHKPMYMMQGLDESFDMVFFVGYHGAISGESSVLSHTYNPSVFYKVELNGVEVGESGINALVASAHGVPIGLVTGDSITKEQAKAVIPAEMVVVKESISRFAAYNLHPRVAHKLIYEAAANVMAQAKSWPKVELGEVCELTMHFLNSDLAELATWIKGVSRSGLRSATVTSQDHLSVYQAFVGVSYITRQAGGR